MIIDTDLEWTLGGKWRTSEEYDTKMNAIGGTMYCVNYSYKKLKIFRTNILVLVIIKKVD